MQPGPSRRLGPEVTWIERERAVLEERPLPRRRPRRPEPDDAGATMAAMPGGATKIEIPRWIQLVGLPLLLLFLWVVAGAARHVVFLFLVAALMALLLNPLVRGLGRVWIPRGLAVAIVYLSFAAAVGLAVVALATVVVNQTRSSADRVDAYFTNEHGQRHQTNAERDLDRLQVWLDRHHLKHVRIKRQGQDFLNNIARAIGPYRRVVLRILGVRFEEHADVVGHRQFAGADFHGGDPGVLSDATRDSHEDPLDDVLIGMSGPDGREGAR